MMMRRSSLVSALPFVVLVITQLHLLRNVSPVYLLPVLMSFFASIWFVVHRWRLLSDIEKIAIYFLLAIFLTPMLTMLAGVVAGKYDGFGEVALGVSRTIFSLPIYLVILALPSHRESINKLLLTVALITLVAALSIPYQFLFGPVEWFADSSERSGLARYATLFGSLTALGLVCGYGILAAIMSIRSTVFSAAVITGIVVGGVLSLQKAAIVNMLIVLLIVPFIKTVQVKKLFYMLFFLLCFFGGVGSYFSDEISRFSDSFRLFSDSESGQTDDVSVAESINERIFDQPTVAIEYHGIRSLWFGIGPVGGGGGFGFPDRPNAHNGVVELLLIGGVGYLLLFSGFVAFIVFQGLKNMRHDHEKHLVRLGVFCIFMQLLNMVFSGLIFFSPSNALFFAVALKCLLLRNRPQILSGSLRL